MTSSLAGAQIVKAIPVVDRVNHIAEIMRTGHWTSKLIPELSDEWGISESMVRQHSAEASRIVRGLTGVDDKKAEVLDLLDEAAEAARAEEDHGRRAKALVEVARALADVVGATAPKKKAIQRIPFGFEE